jgi:hypothetical protein
MNLENISLLDAAQSRSITPENPTGAKGAGGMATEGTGAHHARDLGQGWKISPSVHISAHSVHTIADVKGPGKIEHIWLTPRGCWRFAILRIYWDDQELPSVEYPIGDFFACGWGQYAPLVSQPVCVNPGSAFNCYWPMPFQRRCRITLENIADEALVLFYQVDYSTGEQPDNSAYFHAQFRRMNPLPYGEVYTILDGVSGRGRYVGTYMAWGVNNNGWWGEGELKVYLDGDGEFPTICGTGTEDYFCGSYNFENQATRQYETFLSPSAGLAQVIYPDGLYNSQMRFGMYRWHLPDPIRFSQDIRVTIQALGWRSNDRYLPLQDDIASVAYWYQDLPTQAFPPQLERDQLEII